MSDLSRVLERLRIQVDEDVSPELPHDISVAGTFSQLSRSGCALRT